MSPDTPGFVKSPALKDRIHCVAYVIDASTVSTTYWQPDDDLKTIRQTVNNLGSNKRFFFLAVLRDKNALFLFPEQFLNCLRFGCLIFRDSSTGPDDQSGRSL